MAISTLNERPEVANPCACANWQAGGEACANTGHIPCDECHLVMYCSRTCMTDHGEIHGDDCAHRVTQEDWDTDWEAEKRTPEFIIEGTFLESLTRRLPLEKFSWGNCPAMDLLELPYNEGGGSDRDLKLLSVGGDIRHGIQTMARLPSAFDGTVNYTIGDADMDMVARNVILLLVAYTIEDSVTATDCMIHLWYSSHLHDGHARLLTDRIRPLVAEARRLAEAHGTEEATMFTRNFVNEDRGVTVTLSAAEWKILLGYFDFAPEDDVDEPCSVMCRDEIVCNETFVDERDMIMLRSPAHRRVAHLKFWKDGILQAFAQDTRHFTVPNPILFRDGHWAVEPLADPFDGWDFGVAINRASHMPKNDMYGRLYCYMRELFEQFVKKIHDHEVIFEVQHLGPRDLHLYMGRDSFDRVDVSISPQGVQGWSMLTRQVTSVLEDERIDAEFIFQQYGALLREPGANLHATMIGMYVQGIEDEIIKHDDLAPTDAQRRVASQLFNSNVSDADEYSAEMIHFQDALPLVLNLDEAFRRMVANSDIEKSLEVCKMKLKARNTVVKPWPTRLNIRAGDASEVVAKALGQCMASPHGGNERIVEFRRVAEDSPVKKEVKLEVKMEVE